MAAQQVDIKQDTYILQLKRDGSPTRYLLIVNGKELFTVSHWKHASIEDPHGSISLEAEPTILKQPFILVPKGTKTKAMTVEELVGPFLD